MSASKQPRVVARQRGDTSHLDKKEKNFTKQVKSLHEAIEQAPKKERGWRMKYVLEALGLTQIAPSHSTEPETIASTGSRLADDRACKNTVENATEYIIDPRVISREGLGFNLTYQITRNPRDVKDLTESESIMDDAPKKKEKQYQRKGKLPFPELDHRAEPNRNKQQIKLRLNPDLIKKIDKAATAAGKNRNQWIETILSDTVEPP